MGNPKNDLWEEFLQDDATEHKPAKVPSDGSEWTGEFDRRKTPREENLSDEEIDKLRGDSAANDSEFEGDSAPDGDE